MVLRLGQFGPDKDQQQDARLRKLADKISDTGDVSPEWGSITGDLADQTDLSTEINAKADEGHTHVIADVDGMQGALDAKADASALNGYATDGDLSSAVGALEGTIAGKADASALDGYATDGDLSTAVSTLEGTIAGKADASALDAKADTATTYTKIEVDGLIPDVPDAYTKAEVDSIISGLEDRIAALEGGGV